MTSLSTTGAGYSAEPGSLYASLVSYWKLDETSGNRADSLGNHELVDTHTVVYSANGRFGTNCADFTNVPDDEMLHVANADAGALKGDEGSFTWAMWLKAENFVVNHELAGCWGNSSNRAWRLTVKSVESGTAVVRFQISEDGSSGTITTAGRTSGPDEQIYLSEDTWYHYVAQVRHGTDVRYRVNNGSWVSTDFTGDIQSSNDAFKLGKRFDGLVDEAAFWSKAITDEECSWLYNGGYGLSLY